MFDKFYYETKDFIENSNVINDELENMQLFKEELIAYKKDVQFVLKFVKCDEVFNFIDNGNEYRHRVNIEKLHCLINFVNVFPYKFCILNGCEMSLKKNILWSSSIMHKFVYKRLVRIIKYSIKGCFYEENSELLSDIIFFFADIFNSYVEFMITRPLQETDIDEYENDLFYECLLKFFLN
jgi:hypothetical protein